MLSIILSFECDLYSTITLFCTPQIYNKIIKYFFPKKNVPK